eukprot:377323-Rhodomonas_salina.2
MRDSKFELKDTYRFAEFIADPSFALYHLVGVERLQHPAQVPGYRGADTHFTTGYNVKCVPCSAGFY